MMINVMHFQTLFLEKNVAAVSYTHLDVYKRQVVLIDQFFCYDEAHTLANFGGIRQLPLRNFMFLTQSLPNRADIVTV